MERSNLDDHLGDDELVARAADGDRSVLNELFRRHSGRLERMVRVQLDDRLRGRVDATDIVQDAFLEATRRLDEYLANPPLPFFLWLRQITGEKLIDTHRRHQAQKRDSGRDISVLAGDHATIESLTAHLVGQLTPPSQAAMRFEVQQQVRDALEQLDPVDREVLLLRHFEQLSTTECAAVLNIGESGASSRYVRALQRLRTVLNKYFGPSVSVNEVE